MELKIGNYLGCVHIISYASRLTQNGTALFNQIAESSIQHVKLILRMPEIPICIKSFYERTAELSLHLI